MDNEENGSEARCGRCGRALRRPLSRARGFGTICWRRKNPQLLLWPELEPRKEAASL